MLCDQVAAAVENFVAVEIAVAAVDWRYADDGYWQRFHGSHCFEDHLDAAADLGFLYVVVVDADWTEIVYLDVIDLDAGLGVYLHLKKELEGIRFFHKFSN